MSDSYFVHESAFVDEGAEIGEGTKIDSLFPAWILRRNEEKYSYHFAWPIINFKDWGKEKGWRVWKRLNRKSGRLG